MKSIVHLTALLMFMALVAADAPAAESPFAAGKAVSPIEGLRLAGPPPGKGPHGKRSGGGPPPWAPAHGYRRIHGQYHEYGLSAPPLDLGSHRCNREVMGQILGGAVGAVAGAQIGDGTGRLIAVATGTVIGMIAGREIGRSMDRADALCVDQALEHAADGESIHWRNEGRRYEVTPQQTYERRDGRYCREYVTEARMEDGRPERVSGTACRQPDGSWQIVNS